MTKIECDISIVISKPPHKGRTGYGTVRLSIGDYMFFDSPDMRLENCGIAMSNLTGSKAQKTETPKSV